MEETEKLKKGPKAKIRTRKPETRPQREEKSLTLKVHKFKRKEVKRGAMTVLLRQQRESIYICKNAINSITVYATYASVHIKITLISKSEETGWSVHVDIRCIKSVERTVS